MSNILELAKEYQRGFRLGFGFGVSMGLAIGTFTAVVFTIASH